METILWNKIELQQELEGIPDGSVQELSQKLLRAEATLKERKRRSQNIRDVQVGLQKSLKLTTPLKGTKLRTAENNRECPE